MSKLAARRRHDKSSGDLFTDWAASGIKVARIWSGLLWGTWEPVP
jgi:hypothetical protein